MKTRRATYTVITMMVLCLAGIIATDAVAKPESLLTGILNAYKTKGIVLEARRNTDNKSFDLVLYQDGKISMLRCPDYKPAVPQTPLHTWNMDKIKALTGGVSKAVDVILAMPNLQKVHPIIRAVTLRENKDGNLEFVVSNFVVDGSYRRSFAVDAATWKVVGDVKAGEQIPNPCETPWSVQQQQGKPWDAAEGATVPSASAPAEEKPGFGSAQPAEEGKAVEKGAGAGAEEGADKGAEKAGKGGKGGKGGRGGKGGGSGKGGAERG